MALTEVDTKGIKNASIKLEDIENGTSSDAGKFLKNNDGAAPSWAAVSTDVVADTSPQLGGDLDTNDHEILLDDDHAVKFGAGTDLTIKSDGTNGKIAVTDELDITAGSTTNALQITQTGVITKTDQLVAYSDVVVGSINSGERHYLGLAEDAANGTNTIRFYAPAALANTQTYYLNFASATEGQYLKLGSGANLEFSDVSAGATGGGTNKIFWENEKIIDYNYTITNNHNAMTAGPVEIAATGNGDGSAVVVTVGDGETWTIL